jgi:outer membrane protein TolC
LLTEVPDYTVGLSLSLHFSIRGESPVLNNRFFPEGVAFAEMDKVRNQITIDVITADQNHKTARAKIQVSIKIGHIRPREALRILQDRYKSAISTFDAVLRAEAALLHAKQDVLKARYEY